MFKNRKPCFNSFIIKSVAVWLFDYKCALSSCDEPSTAVHTIDGDPDNTDLKNLMPVCIEHFQVYRVTCAPFKITRKMLTVRLLRRLVEITGK